MGLIQPAIDAIRSRLRRKLLALVLFPILLIVPVALLLSLWWGTRFTYDQLFFKVTTDLSVAHDVFQRVRHDYLSRLALLGESYAFRSALGEADRQAVHQQLARVEQNAGFSWLWLTDSSGQRWGDGNDRVSRSSPLRSAAAQGEAVSGVEIFSAEDLRAISEQLASTVRLPLLETPRARPTTRQVEDRGMMIRVIYPLRDEDGKVLALLDGGVLLNRNFDFVDGIRDLVYGEGSLLEGSLGTVTVFLDDVRISTNVPLRAGERALGTRVSDQVRTQVLDEGRHWIDRAFVVNDWYISGYEPIVDSRGKRVGILYAGYLEAPYRRALFGGLALLIGLFIVLMLLASSLAVWGARSIFRPVEAISQVVAATRRGEQRRIGEIASQDELGELARQFDAMLDLLQQQHRRIEQAANELEHKVEERTAELRRSNEELRQTIQVLRRTRQQLVVAEKLAALGELTAGVAHEINNPTAVMLGNLENIIEELGDAAAPVREDLDLVIEQVYRIQDIVNRLLQYARPDAYAGYLSYVDVNEQVQACLRLVEHLHKQQQFDIQLNLQASAGIEINVQELQQVLVNLLVNAIHALPETNGVVRVCTRDWEQRGVVVEVQDNGHGIPLEKLDQVFNPFFTTKAQGEGTGLGLSVSYGLVRRYGGLITVDSAEGAGTTFAVYLLAVPEFHEDEEMLVEQLAAVVEEGDA